MGNKSIIGYMNGSLKDPQIEPGSNFNPNSNDFADVNNTCGTSSGDKSPSASVLNTGAVMPVVTNRTACQDGFFIGYKDWCMSHAVNCAGNMTMGDFPDLILKAREQISAGEKAANGSGTAMCPLGQNAAFCKGWDNNNGDYGNSDCSDDYASYTGIGTDLIGCILDSLKQNQVGAFPMLDGKWNFMRICRLRKAIYST
jgi:hypothetical protein